MTDKTLVPVNMNIVIHEFEEKLMLEIAGPFESMTVFIPRGKTPALVMPAEMTLRAVAWHYHYKTGELRAIYECKGHEVHIVYDLRDYQDDLATDVATIKHIEDPDTNEELEDDYNIVWAPEDSELTATTPVHG